jgi:alginate O-acetyltransferase complex protein AlgI
MLFNSIEFLFVFLPLTFFVYFWLNHARKLVAGKAWLVLSSLFFYGWWNPVYLPLMLVSISVNFWLGRHLGRPGLVAIGPLRLRGQILLATGLVFNLGLLAYFKYADFFIANLNHSFDAGFDLPGIILPLGISFFTFTQIAYLVDCHREGTKEYDFLNYCLFVTFFPHLIAGPILHHKEMMPQFASTANCLRRYKNILPGLFLIAVGLFKKVLIADTFARWANAGYGQIAGQIAGQTAPLSFLDAWATSLSYTFQLYYDFSGYTDMAIGAALLFNIRLPINFNSPYQATDIQDFWRRWHITLSRFLRDYLYIPLGGNRRGKGRAALNLVLTFVLGGLWHGASWMFVIWGGLHGLAMVVHRLWMQLGFRMNPLLAWFVTFNFINLSWVFFRAENMDSAMRILRGMAGLGQTGAVTVLPALQMPQWMGLSAAPNATAQAFACLSLALAMVGLARNSQRRILQAPARQLMNHRLAIGYGVMALAAVYATMASSYTEFIYFNF